MTITATRTASVEQIEAAFSGVLAEIEVTRGNSPEDTACNRRTASTLYVEALIAYQAGNIESTAVALHLARFWAVGSVNAPCSGHTGDVELPSRADGWSGMSDDGYPLA
jgi:hypothetical protein